MIEEIKELNIKTAMPSDAPALTELSEKTDAIIHRMMHLEPARRYPNFKSLIADLELALAAW